MAWSAQFQSRPYQIAVCLLCLGVFASGCRTPARVGPVAYRYFERPAPDDAWSRKIRSWQQRARQTSPSPAAVEGAAADGAPADAQDAGELRAKYDAFRGDRKRTLARDLAGWIQSQARAHYVPDGAVDHWATLEETFQSNGDDCDGLELIAFHFLRELGFPPQEVYRAIVVRREDGQHHMVTLWFEDPEDPWVIDPTGAMTSGMPRMSQVPGWAPLKVFSDDEDFTVRDVALH